MGAALSPPLARLRLVIHGAVQGVGFRPFVYRLAGELSLAGWVNNSPQGVVVEVEGPPGRLQEMLLRLEKEQPPLAAIHSLEPTFLDPAGYRGFEIRPSLESGAPTALVLPDIATCPDCRREIRSPSDRRFRYPFANCTNCGPRFTIIEALPYDRPHTTMKGFPLCPRCLAEYEDPADRRFHAQPIACPECGPHLELWDRQGAVLATHHQALLETARALRQGGLVALKGLGGFQFLADAHNTPALERLRQGKQREEKPFALMYPSLEQVEAHCRISAMEARLLCAPEAPIVLLRRRDDDLSSLVAPGHPCLGIMLPYTPLHHLLIEKLDFPLVATSGNLADEPICIDEGEALARLGDIADLFLVHNRPIRRHADDSIVRLVAGRELVLRRARGYAPLPVLLSSPLPTAMAVGAHLKNTVALAVGNQVFVSQHLGDLETAPALAAFDLALSDLQQLYSARPEAVACDLHPDYLSTRRAQGLGLRVVEVQHHYAHVLSCMAENHLAPPVLGVCWDGTGYGPDQMVWGGEFLLVEEKGYRRLGHLRPFPLPGGDQAVREPRRAALGLLWALCGEEALTLDLPALRAFTPAELRVLAQMLRRGVNTPLTSSAGRLFDATASLLGLCQHNRFEGQTAMQLEFALEEEGEVIYPVTLLAGEPATLDWGPMIEALLADQRAGLGPGRISARFHNGLVEGILAIARLAGQEQVALSGGCFQNQYLSERAITRLRAEGFRPHWHQRIPPNDGGISLGQLVAAGRILAMEV
ncbi:MAG: carbamoyltransferase HypF [Candidatus Latescibacteria bacterium]|nr:carbamoyltransferase HypF [Candidatus Latescibacterota bacterium]